MAKDVLMPQMGYDMDSGTLLRWLKEPGEAVERGEAIAEIETDKVNIEIEAFDSGVLAQTLIDEGDTVPVGEVIAVIGDPGEEIPERTAPANGKAKEEPTEQPAEASQQAEAEQPVATQEQQAQPTPAETPPAQAPQVVERAPGERVRASPLVRRLAKENNLDLQQVEGTGPHGRIVKRDIQPYLEGEKQVPPAAAATPPGTAAAPEAEMAGQAPAPTTVGEGELQDMSRMRQTIARRMQESFRDVPHIFITMSINMAPAMQLRKQVNEALDEESQVTVNDLIIKAAAMGLRDFPVINASYADGKRQMHDNIDVNFAVAMEDGLISPFIPGADRLTLGEIARMTKDKARRAREGGLKPEEYAGGTFTISNLGMFGVDHFTAVINPPQAAILSIGAAKMQPVWNAEAEDFEPKFLMQVTIAADHRVTDGAESSRFLQRVKELLENPMRMLAG